MAPLCFLHQMTSLVTAPTHTRFSPTPAPAHESIPALAWHITCKTIHRQDGTRHFGSRQIGNSHFGNTTFWHCDILALRHFATQTFWHFTKNRHFATQTFCHLDFLPHQTFCHQDISPPRHFATLTFSHTRFFYTSKGGGRSQTA